MKVNNSLLLKLKEKSINLDIDSYAKQLRASYQSQGSVASSEVESSGSSQPQTATTTPASTLFRVRAVGQRKEEQSTPFNMTQNAWLKMDSMDFARSTLRSSQVMKRQNSGVEIESNPMGRTMAQSFYKGEEQNKKQQKPNQQQANRPMTVSMYKDKSQNKAREELFQFDEQDNQELKNALSRDQKKSRKNSTDSGNVSEEVSEDDEEKQEKSVFISKKETFKENLEQEQGDDEEEKQTNKFEQLLSQYWDKIREEGDIKEEENQELQKKVKEEFMSETINQELIEKITQVSVDEFQYIRRVTLRHDCASDSLQLLGDMLTNLRELNMSDSIANSLRDLGTSMSNLQILWISRSKVTDLAGINAFPLLREFYASYNEISSIEELFFHSTLEVIDLEGNDLKDIKQVIDVLETISTLKNLTLQCNPIEKEEVYHKVIREKLTALESLDENYFSANTDNDKKEQTLTRKKSILSSKDKEDQEEEGDTCLDLYSSLKKLRWNGGLFLADDVIKEMDFQLKNELSEQDMLTYSVKKTANKSNKKMTSEASNAIFQITKEKIQPQQASQSAVSSLLEGTDMAFCGNPLKALKHKRKNDLVDNKKSESTSINSESNLSMALPKNILNLFDQFKQDVNSDIMDKFKEELKAYDKEVEKQIKVKAVRKRPPSSERRGSSKEPAATMIVKRPRSPFINEGVPQTPSTADSEMSKSRITLKKIQIKPRNSSSSQINSQTKEGNVSLNSSRIKAEVNGSPKQKLKLKENQIEQSIGNKDPLLPHTLSLSQLKKELKGRPTLGSRPSFQNRAPSSGSLKVNDKG